MISIDNEITVFILFKARKNERIKSQLLSHYSYCEVRAGYKAALLQRPKSELSVLGKKRKKIHTVKQRSRYN